VVKLRRRAARSRRPDERRLSDTVLVVGSGRSGTTWLVELLNAAGTYHVLFEPFSPREGHNPQWHGTPRYLRRGASYAHRDEVEQILLGGASSEWVDRIASSDPSSSRVLVKEIRLNQMLGWVQENFPEVALVYLVRDPWSTAWSATQHDWGDRGYSNYLSRRRLVRDHLAPDQLELLGSADSLFQKNVVKWAVDTRVALRSLDREGRVTSVFYEHLAQRPEQELARLADYCGHPLEVPDGRSLRRRSATTSHGSVTDPRRDDFGRAWEGELTAADQAFADRVLTALGLDPLYAERNVPALAQPLDLRPPD
jgi:hypothetical protein